MRKRRLRRSILLFLAGAALLSISCAGFAPVVEKKQPQPEGAPAAAGSKAAIDGQPTAPAAPAPTGESSSQPLTSEQALFLAPDLAPYARANLGTFKVYRLSNGIPFIFKENSENRIFALRIVLRGHTLFTPKEKAGIEAVTLAMLTKGSERYPYEEIQRMLYEKSSAIGPSFGSADLTAFGLTTLTKYVPSLFDVFADSFLHPLWDPDQFDKVMNDFKVRKQRSDNDPYTRSVRTLEKNLFAGHPYYASANGVDDSLASITLPDVRSYYEHTFVPDRLFVVGVGDFDSDELYRMLDRTIGLRGGDRIDVPAPPSFAGNIRPDIITEAFAESKGLAYMRGAFALPSPDSPEYPAILLALGMLDDILYDVVRAQHGATYSVSAHSYGLAANYGAISIYKTTVPGEIKPYIDESIAILASGRCLAARVEASAAGKSGVGSPVEAREHKGTYVPIADAIRFYKDQYVTRFYAGQATNLSVASQIAGSLFYHGDYRDYLLLMDRLAAVTPAQIVGVTEKYLLHAPMLWVAVGDEQVLSTIGREDYRVLPKETVPAPEGPS